MRKFVAVATAAVLIAALLPVFASANTALLPGDKGYEVKAIQTVLKNKKLYSGEVDGIYDKETHEAVKQFILSNSLEGEEVSLEVLEAMGLYSGKDAAQSCSVKAKEKLRLTASSKGKVLAALDNGAKAFIISSSKGWTKIRLDGVGVEGYVRTSSILKKKGDSTELTVPERSISRGESNADVVTLQKRLIELGYYDYTPSGSFGSVTYMAVRAFQQHNSLEVNGVATIETLQLLFSDEAQPRDLVLTQTEDDPHSVYSPGDDIREQIADYSQTFLGIPYILGAKGPRAYDCSGYLSKVYRDFGIQLPRSAYEQGYSSETGKKIKKIADLRVGDIVCFNTNATDGDRCDHVGIFLGENRFAHASFAEGEIIVSDITKYYWKNIFSWGKRVIPDDVE